MLKLVRRFSKTVTYNSTITVSLERVTQRSLIVLSNIHVKKTKIETRALSISVISC